MMATWLMLLLTPARAAGSDAEPELREDIAVRARAGGPALALPPPRATTPVIDEVIDSLAITRKETAPAGTLLASGAPGGLFPEPPFLRLPAQRVTTRYERWSFEVFAGDRPVWRLEGEGRPREGLAWDGTSGSEGKTAVRVGREYRFRFSAHSASGRVDAQSEPAVFASLSLPEPLGGARLEVASTELFARGAALSPGAARYLDELAARLRRVALADGDDYQLELHEPDPQAARAEQRAQALKKYLSRALLIHPRRVRVLVARAGERGEVLVCPLPAEKGATIRQE